MYKIWNFFLENRNFSYIIVVALVIFGLLSVINIPKESAPEVRVPVAIVNTVYPGSSALDIEKLITNKIEDRLINNLENINKVTSTSSDGISTVVVEFKSDADIDKSIQETKDEVDFVKSDLPNDANDPIVSEVNFVDQPILTVSVSSDLQGIELSNLIDSLETEIKTVPGVSKISISGLSEREVQVIVKKEALQQYNLSIVEIVNAIRSANSSLPVGSIELDGIEYAVKFDGNISDPEELKDIAILNSGNQPIYIRDIADIYNGLSDQNTYARVSLQNNPSENAVSLNVFKSGGGDVTKVSDGVKNKLIELEDDLLADTVYLTSFDTGEFVKDDLKNLSLTALQTVLLVMIILFIALGWREAIIAGLAIPLSFLIAFIALEKTGNTINFISLFSLILAVGILVDSAIVITEAIHKNMKLQAENNGSKIEAAKKAIKEFYYPLTTGTATTIAVFAPLFILSGVTGQFISSIPFTIIFVLLAALFVALALVPLIASTLLKRKSATKLEQKQDEYAHRAELWYKEKLNLFIGNKKNEKIFFRTIIGLFIISLIFPFTGIVKVIFFPGEDSDFIFIDIEKPEGTTLEQTDLLTRQVEDILYTNENINSFVTNIGSGSQYGSGGSGEKLANITVILDEDRGLNSSEILNNLRKDFKEIKTGEIRIFEAEGGPPTGSPINIKIFGEDIDEINNAIKVSEDILSGISGVVEIDSSAKNDGTEFRLIVDRAKASQFGLTASDIALYLRTAIFGAETTTINTDQADIDVIVKLNLADSDNPYKTNNTNIETIQGLTIPTRDGRLVPVGSIINTEIGVSNSVLNHENGTRLGSVSADTNGEKTIPEIISQFQKEIEGVSEFENLRISYGGETEEIQRTFKEMGLALILGVILILAILVLQFNSYRHAIYVIAVLPLALTGVIFGLAITGKPISFPSIMGFIALAGIVVNNSIILIDVMNSLRKENPDMSIKDVVLDGAASRLRPIILTTLTTVIGIIPLTYASSLWSPLAFSIIFGLSFSVFITLIIIPILYYNNPGVVSSK